MVDESTQFSDTQLLQVGQNHINNDDDLKIQQDKINQNLRNLGAVKYDFWLPESHALAGRTDHGYCIRTL